MIKKTILGIITAMLLIPSLVLAADHKMVIQVNSASELTHKMALINAKNLKTQLGKDNIDVEVVVFGPGIKLLHADGWQADRITQLQKDYGVNFSVCGGTLKAIAKRNNGVMPELVGGVSEVVTGAIRILQLQEEGYHYMRP